MESEETAIRREDFFLGAALLCMALIHSVAAGVASGVAVACSWIAEQEARHDQENADGD